MHIAIGQVELEILHTANRRGWFVYLKAGSWEWHREWSFERGGKWNCQ